MNELHLFAGAGGGILGGILLGHTCVCAVEIEPYCRKVLFQRQRDGILPKFPIWDDVRTFDGKPWRGLVDVVCGGFPCTDISVAGKGIGIMGPASGLWAENRRVVCEVRPKYVFVENSPALVKRGLGTILGDLAQMGYDAKWGVLSAKSLGAWHERARIWILASDTEQHGVQRQGECGKVGKIKQGPWEQINKDYLRQILEEPSTCMGLPKPLLLRNDDGLADWVHRTKAIGNGQVPAVVKLAWEVLSGN